MVDVITLSEMGVTVARKLENRLRDVRLHVHNSVKNVERANSYKNTHDLLATLFKQTDGIVFIGPSGIMVRDLAPLLKSKYTDPPVVVVDVMARFAISLVSGHEGGANALAVTVANILGAEPVVTTTTDAAKTLMVGVGCRRGAAADAIVSAINHALAQIHADIDEVRFLASADIKKDEAGLVEAAEILGIPLRLIASEEIRSCLQSFNITPLAEEKVNLPAVAEPAALLAGRRTTLILPKIIKNQVTVAIARENSLS